MLDADTCMTCERCIVQDTILDIGECDNPASPFYRAEVKLDFCCPWRKDVEDDT